MLASYNCQSHIFPVPYSESCEIRIHNNFLKNVCGSTTETNVFGEPNLIFKCVTSEERYIKRLEIILRKDVWTVSNYCQNDTILYQVLIRYISDFLLTIYIIETWIHITD